jgi:hypothetical protein
MISEKKRTPCKKKSLVALRAVIKGCAAEACEIREKEIRKTKERQRYEAWDRKRKLGWYTRHNLIAYGFLRGRAYLELEPSRENMKLQYRGCVDGNSIDIDLLFAICRQHAPELTWFGKKLTLDDLRAWIQEGQPFFLTKEEILAANPPEKMKQVA